jgi:hypothetical protein
MRALQWVDMNIKMKALILSIVIVALILLSYVFFFKDYLAVDTCLDSGGKWSEKSSECLFNSKRIKISII